MRAPVPEFANLVERFDHVAIAVWNIGESLDLPQLLAGEFRDGGIYEAGAFRWAQWNLPAWGKLEIVEPLDRNDEGHFLVRFLRQRGEGLHHLTLKVADIKAAISHVRDLGFDVVGINVESVGWQEAFVHPKSAHGVLVQLAQWEDWGEPEALTIDHVLRAT